MDDTCSARRTSRNGRTTRRCDAPRGTETDVNRSPTLLTHRVRRHRVADSVDRPDHEEIRPPALRNRGGGGGPGHRRQGRPRPGPGAGKPVRAVLRGGHAQRLVRRRRAGRAGHAGVRPRQRLLLLPAGLLVRGRQPERPPAHRDLSPRGRAHRPVHRARSRRHAGAASRSGARSRPTSTRARACTTTARSAGAAAESVGRAEPPALAVARLRRRRRRRSSAASARCSTSRPPSSSRWTRTPATSSRSPAPATSRRASTPPSSSRRAPTWSGWR